MDLIDNSLSEKALTLFCFLEALSDNMLLHPITLRPIAADFADLVYDGKSVWDVAPFIEFKKLEVCRNFVESGALSDSRYGLKPEDLIWKTENKKGITLRQYSEGVFRMKRNKLPKTELLSNIDLTNIGDTLYMNVKFHDF
jgi:hypothetical protein